ncbi:MAG: hypothetical protein K1X86_15405 [Ignavibacteria bacterium]|nr:hypothetical protein [Ignavibacteria bacterium]
MRDISEAMLTYQEGVKVPRCALYCELKALGTVFDVSKYVRSEPGVEHSCDYRENLTYLNETAIILNDYDNVVSGILEAAEEPEIALYRYYDVPGGKEDKIKIFGGYVPKGRINTDEILGTIELTIIPYFGRAEETALRLTRKYTDEYGLRLNNCEVWITKANFEGHVLKSGVHVISVKSQEGYPYAKLDDGDWTALDAGTNTVLETAQDVFGNYQKCEIHYEALSYSGEKNQKVIVRNEGDLLPETFYFYPLVKEIITKAFNEMGVTNIVYDRFLIPTYDGRRVMSGVSRVDNDPNNTFIPVAICSNGTDKIYISGSTGALTNPFKNQIWEYNHASGEVRLIYETTLNERTWYKLVWHEGHLIAFIDNKEEDEERGFIQYFTFWETGVTYTTVATDHQYDTLNSYYKFHHTKFLNKVLFLGYSGGNKTVIAQDIPTGAIANIVTHSDIELSGANFIWDNNTVVYYYYLRNLPESLTGRKLCRVSYSNGWQAEEEITDWFSAEEGSWNDWYPIQYTAEGKVLLLKRDNTKAVFFNITAMEFSANLCPPGKKIFSPVEIDGKMYFIMLDDESGDQNICYFENNEITTASFKKITPYDLVQHAGYFGFQQLCGFTDIDNLKIIAALSKYPALLLKFADNIEPFIEGELDTEGRTIRAVMEEISNNFLAWLRVDENNTGYFVRRAASRGNDALVLKKKYTATRITQSVYNEKYDGIVIVNGNKIKYGWGETGIFSRVLNLDLQFIPDDFIIDMCKYFYDYYSTSRLLKKISYLPTFFNYEPLDPADLTDYGMDAGIIHTIRPGSTRAEIEVLVNE